MKRIFIIFLFIVMGLVVAPLLREYVISLSVLFTDPHTAVQIVLFVDLIAYAAIFGFLVYQSGKGRRKKRVLSGLYAALLAGVFFALLYFKNLIIGMIWGILLLTGGVYMSISHTYDFALSLIVGTLSMLFLTFLFLMSYVGITFVYLDPLVMFILLIFGIEGLKISKLIESAAAKREKERIEYELEKEKMIKKLEELLKK